MGEYFVKLHLKRSPVYFGEILSEDVLPTLGLSVSEAARRLGISRQQLHSVLACTHPKLNSVPIGIGATLTGRPSHTTQHTGPNCAIRLIRQNQILENISQSD